MRRFRELLRGRGRVRERGRAHLAALLATAILAHAGSAHAWGRVGHRAASELAAKHLSVAASAVVAELLDPGEDLANASLWADAHRRDVPASSAWHYVNVPLAEGRYHSRFCQDDACVVGKIRQSQEVLASSSALRAEKQHALRLLVHLVEDLHQPVHVGDRGDRGGNDLPILFMGRPTNLHRIWDEDLVHVHTTSEADWLAELERLATPERRRQWVTGSVEDWATESLRAARSAYRFPDGRALVAGAKLDARYSSLQLPVVRRRLAQAGIRLAGILNAIFR